MHIREQHTIRRHSSESNGSAAREFNAYQQYRQQLQSQSNSNGSSDAEREACIPKHHNPLIEATASTRDYLAPTELRQRVCTFQSIRYYFPLNFEIIPFLL